MDAGLDRLHDMIAASATSRHGCTLRNCGLYCLQLPAGLLSNPSQARPGCEDPASPGGFGPAGGEGAGELASRGPALGAGSWW
jgi:hypothetical protein